MQVRKFADVQMKILLPENFPNPRRKGTAAAPPKYKGGAALRCCPHFFCHGFCKPTHGSTCIFFKRQEKKIQELQPTHQQKPMPKKDEGS